MKTKLSLHLLFLALVSLSGFIAAVPPTVAATTIFDNTTGIFNGVIDVTPTRWLAGRFCVGPQPYALDSVSLLLNSANPNRPHISSVRLQIYSQTNNRPFARTGPMLHLSGSTNPITLGLADTLVAWTPAAPFHLSAHTCYWVVLSVDSGDVVYATLSQTQPAGDAAALGWDVSSNAGATWGAPTLFHNLKMRIEGTAIPTPLLAVDGATAIPGGIGNFTSLTRGPSLSGSSIAFYGAGSGGQQGIYVQNRFIPQDPVRIADLNTPIPNGSGNFLSFAGVPAIPSDPVIPGDPLISGDNVVFYGAGSGGQRGIYALINSSRLRVADTSTAIPGGSGNFTGFTRPGIPPNPIISGDNAVFYGAGSGGQQGVYARINGSLRRIADTTTAIPGGTGSFTAIPVDPIISGDGVAFVGHGSGGQQGVYLSKAGSLSVIADTQTAIPNGVGNFVAIPGDPTIDGDRVAFVGFGSGGQRGVYLVPDVGIPPNPIKVADMQTAIPGGIGNFTGFGAVSVSETDVAFLGHGASGQTGIYDLNGGQLIKAIAVGDTISGKIVTGLNFTRGGLWGDPIAFQATFDDGSQALYTIAAVAPPFALRITAVARLGNDLRLSFNSLAGTNYVLQSRTDLVPGSWATLPGTTNSGNGSTVQQTVTNAVNLPQQFFRVEQLP